MKHHPWFVQYCRTHDPIEWFEVERQMFPEKPTKKKVKRRRKKK